MNSPPTETENDSVVCAAKAQKLIDGGVAQRKITRRSGQFHDAPTFSLSLLKFSVALLIFGPNVCQHTALSSFADAQMLGGMPFYGGGMGGGSSTTICCSIGGGGMMTPSYGGYGGGGKIGEIYRKNYSNFLFSTFFVFVKENIIHIDSFQSNQFHFRIKYQPIAGLDFNFRYCICVCWGLVCVV